MVVASVLEIDRGYGRSPPHSSIVLVCQANFRAAWRTKNRFDHYSRFVFAVCPHTNNSSQSHFKCVLVHDPPQEDDCWPPKKDAFRCGDFGRCLLGRPDQLESGFKRQLAARNYNQPDRKLPWFGQQPRRPGPPFILCLGREN